MNNELSNEELNALIAEKVMGLQVLGVTACERDPECGYLEVPYDPIDGRGESRSIYLRNCRCDNEKRATDTDYFGHFAGCVEVVPDYSLCIADAMLVVEKMREKEFDVEMEAASEGCWMVKMNEVTEFDDSLPRAICLAALAATEKQ